MWTCNHYDEARPTLLKKERPLEITVSDYVGGHRSSRARRLSSNAQYKTPPSALFTARIPYTT